ncbi:hypothetical protein ES708_21418 [subsurface metagenome]
MEKFYGKEIIIIGGGCGFAPIRSLLYNLMAEKDKFKGVTLCYGSKSPEDCIYKPFIEELRNTDKKGKNSQTNLNVFFDLGNAEQTNIIGEEGRPVPFSSIYFLLIFSEDVITTPFLTFFLGLLLTPYVPLIIFPLLVFLSPFPIIQ